MANAMKWLMHVPHVRNFSVIFSCLILFSNWFAAGTYANVNKMSF